MTCDLRLPPISRHRRPACSPLKIPPSLTLRSCNNCILQLSPLLPPHAQPRYPISSEYPLHPKEFLLCA
jgi:hypothetical protein